MTAGGEEDADGEEDAGAEALDAVDGDAAAFAAEATAEADPTAADEDMATWPQGRARCVVRDALCVVRCCKDECERASPAAARRLVASVGCAVAAACCASRRARRCTVVAIRFAHAVGCARCAAGRTDGRPRLSRAVRRCCKQTTSRRSQGDGEPAAVTLPAAGPATTDAITLDTREGQRTTRRTDRPGATRQEWTAQAPPPPVASARGQVDRNRR